MGTLNQDFQYPKIVHFVVALVFVLFLALFAMSVVTIMGAFETDMYTNNTMASIQGLNN